MDKVIAQLFGALSKGPGAMEAMLDANPQWVHKNLADAAGENALHSIEAQQWPSATASCIVRSEVSRRLGRFGDMFDAQLRMIEVQYIRANSAQEYLEARDNALILFESVESNGSDRRLLFRCRVLAAECSYFAYDLEKKIPLLCQATDEVISLFDFARGLRTDAYFNKLISLIAFCADRGMNAVRFGSYQSELNPRLGKLAAMAQALIPDDFGWYGQDAQTEGILGILSALEEKYA